MARYRGPQTRIARKFGEPIFGPDKVMEKKNYPPGMHGLTKKEENLPNMEFIFAKSRR
jgi:small subunit ribosomal protein S4